MKQVTISTPFITLIVLDYGAIIQKLLVKDKNGESVNVVVGFNSPEKYLEDNKFLGACIGRYAGRISNGKFELERETYDLHQKDGVHLHGGKKGFGLKYWTIEEVHQGRQPFVKLSYHSKHLEEGYPGNLKVYVTYKLINNHLHIIHEASTDLTTVINLTNHSYFRLDGTSQIDDYNLQLNCSRMVETYANLLPTGALIPVNGTSFDFLNEKKIGSTRLDTPFVIDSKSKVAGKVSSDKTAISMEVSTNQPALVCYTPPEFPAICFETQNYPDAPNHKNFPSSRLRPGEIYKNESKFVFDLL
ncbi:galactose mutarotase [Maribacter algarum]|uniref:Galactose mutarotase n=1 Tax=Maribacter algarum (ex Zhang et al. 2020) TaxID=2578118 RepID=A0A5S3PGS7_9FLAO|nr:aldose epimerase family protein [Maribacter algarum]TMM53306.1 galactose mutarotase [Maribacter algarum]